MLAAFRTFASSSASATAAHFIALIAVLATATAEPAIAVEPLLSVVRAPLSSDEVVLQCRVQLPETVQVDQVTPNAAAAKTSVTWEKVVRAPDGSVDQLLPVESDNGRIRFRSVVLNETVLETSLIFQSLRRADSGSYICRARNEFHNESDAALNLLVLEPPEVEFVKIETPDARSAVLFWSVAYDGNSPVQSVAVQLRNYSVADSEWLPVEKIEAENLEGSSGYRSLVSNLLPTATYGFQLAGVNEIGQGDWVAMNATMPSDVPGMYQMICAI